MDTKAAFEKWFDDVFGKSTTPEEIVVRDMVRQGWAASRAAIEIELPEALGDDYGHEIFLLLPEVESAITSHGIRIKGEAE